MRPVRAGRRDRAKEARYSSGTSKIDLLRCGCIAVRKGLKADACGVCHFKRQLQCRPRAGLE